MIQLYKALQEGSTSDLSALLHKAKYCWHSEVAHLVREAVVDPSASGTVSTLRCLLRNHWLIQQIGLLIFSRCDQYSPRLTWLQFNNETKTGLSANFMV
jgi:hypothetical protein